MQKLLGFSLVELLTALAVAAVLVAAAMPSFSKMVADNRLAASTNDLLTAIHYTRSESIKRGGSASICADGGDWANWTITAPGDDGQPYTLQVATGTAMAITGTAGCVAFNSLGQTGQPVALTICDSNSHEGRVIDISVVGRPRTSEAAC